MEAILVYLFGGITLFGLSVWGVLLVCGLLASWAKSRNKDDKKP